MPRLVDYRCRQAFLQEAAFAIVRDEGVAAVTRRAIAQTLGTSVQTVRRSIDPDSPLVVLAAREADQRRRARRWQRHPGGAPVTVRALLPDSPDRVDEEVVWAELSRYCSRPTPGAVALEDSVAARFHVAQHGWFDPAMVPHQHRPPLATPAERQGRRHVAELVDARRDDLLRDVAVMVSLLGLADDATSRVTAVLVQAIHGTVVAICQRSITVDEAADDLEVLMDLLARPRTGNLAPARRPDPTKVSA
jgi:hypothetical protein